jgi:hypothetical protein
MTHLNILKMTVIRGNKQIPDEDDCRCGRPVKITERKKLVKKVIKKR